MGLMVQPRKNDRKNDRHKNKTLQLRLHSLLRKQLEALVERNLSTLTAEVIIAIRRHLAENGLWPPKGDSTE